jgi:hypothetical protein
MRARVASHQTSSGDIRKDRLVELALDVLGIETFAHCEHNRIRSKCKDWQQKAN